MSGSIRISLIHNRTGQTKMVMLKLDSDQMFKRLLKMCKNKFNSKPKQLYLLPSGTLLSRDNINILRQMTHAEILVTRGEPPNIDQISKHKKLVVKRNQRTANVEAKRAARQEALNQCLVDSKKTLQGQDMNRYQTVVLHMLIKALRDWHMTVESNVLGMIIEYADFEPAFEVFDRGLLVSPDFLEMNLRPSKRAIKGSKGALTSRLNGFLFAGKYSVTLEILELGEGSTVSIGLVGQIFDPLRRVGVGFAKDSWGYCFDGVFRHAGEWVIHHRNKRRKSNHIKYRRTGKSLKAGDKMVLYISLGDGVIKNFIVYLNGTKFCWPQIVKHLPYPLAFAVSIAHVDDKVRILPDGDMSWFGDYVQSRSGKMILASPQDEPPVTTEPPIPQEVGEVVENGAVSPVDETCGENGVILLNEESS